MTIEALSVRVTVERLSPERDLYDVDVTAHPKCSDVWVVDMLRQIADGIERDGRS